MHHPTEEEAIPVAEVLASGRGLVDVAYHQFGIIEDAMVWPAPVPHETNGLADPGRGGAVIRTGIHSGVVDVSVDVRAAPPPTVDHGGWDEIVEISLAARGARAGDDPLARPSPPAASPQLRIGALMADAPAALPALNPWGPGPCRVRVHARGRDHNIDGVDFGPVEEYLVVVWPGPPAPQAPHKQTDRYGAEYRMAASAGR